MASYPAFQVPRRPNPMSNTANSKDKEAVRTWLRILSCEIVVEQNLRSRFRSYFSRTLPQFDVLSELERADRPLAMSELSRELMVSNANVTGVIDRLEKSGLVERNRAKHDRRVLYIQLSKEGRRQFNKMAKHHERWVGELFGGLNEKEMSRLQSLLLKARQSASAAAADPK